MFGWSGTGSGSSGSGFNVTIFYVDIENRFWCADRYVLIFILSQTNREKGDTEKKES